MSKNSQNRILKIILATIIVVGAFGIYYFTKEKKELIPMVDIVLPQSITIDDETEVSFEWTDDNTGEDLIIQSDKQTYFGVNQSIVYFTITNINTIDQEINIRYLFEDSNASLKNIEKINQDQSTSNLTSVTKPTVRFKNMKGFTSSTNYYLDNIKSGETNYYQATISYPPNSKAEFYVEAKGKNSYGLLDPFYDSSGLVGYWSFNGEDTNWGTNTTNDLSGQGNHGTMTNMSTTTSPVVGKIGQGLDFDGSDDYVNVGDPVDGNLDFGMGDFSLCNWINLDVANSRNMMVSKQDWGVWTSGWVFEIHEDNTIRFFREDGGTVGVGGEMQQSSTTVDANIWNYVCMVYDYSNDIKLYLNSVETSYGSNTFGIWSTLSNNYDFQIGIAEDVNRPFNGKIDEVLIYNKALTQAEITQLYNTGKATHSASQTNKLTDGLVLMQSFDGNHMDWSQSSAEARDQSGQGNHGDVVGATAVKGKVGQALGFDGVDDYLDITDSSDFTFGTSDFTMTLWLKSNSFATPQSIIVFTNSSNAMGYTIHNTGGLQVLVYDGNWLERGQALQGDLSGWETDTWYQVTLVRSGTSFKGYRDGVLLVSDTLTAGYSFIDYSIETVGAVRYPNGDKEQFFNGQIDEVRIYRRALSQKEITELYNMGKATHSSSQTNKLTDGLVLMQSFDGNHMDWSQSSAEARDQSGQGNHGDVVGATAVKGTVGQALSFDGSDDYVNIGDPADGSLDFGTVDFSGCTWIYPYVSSEHRIIFSKQDWGVWTGAYNFQVLTDDTIAFWVEDGNGGVGQEIQQSSNTVTEGQWNYVCFTYDYNNAVKLYINGLEASYGTNTFGQWRDLDNSYNFQIGVAENINRPFDGKIDEVRIYNRALSQSEITQLYNMGKSKISN